MCGTYHNATFFFIKYFVKMSRIVVIGIPDTPTGNIDTIAIEVLSIAVEERLVRISSSVDLLSS